MAGRSQAAGEAPEHVGRDLAAPLAAAAAGLLFVLVAVLAAVVEVLLVPVRVGTLVVPISVVLGVATTTGVPVLAAVATARTLGAALPVAAWIVTVIFLSQARPEGDVLLVGTAPLVYVTYALLVLGAVSGIATVLVLDRRRMARLPRTAPRPPAAPRAQAAPNAPALKKPAAGKPAPGRPASRSPARERRR